MKLFHDWQSSASWRVRWALALKQVPHELIRVDVASGEHDVVLALLNPMRQVPTLALDDGRHLAESVAIIEWLDETIPDPPLLPTDPFARAKTRQLVQLINAGVHPLQNTMVRKAWSSDREEQRLWACRWIERGLAAYDEHVQGQPGRFSLGDRVSMADLYLIPQVKNAERFQADISACRRVLDIYAACLETREAKETGPRPGEA